MNEYYNSHVLTEQEINNEVHRHVVGGIFEYQGKLQLELCKKYGLLPHHKMLDFGCGCLRAGVKLLDYLNYGNYYGIDVNKGLLEAGLCYEIPKAGLDKKISYDNFLITDKFLVDFFNVNFDFVLAQSVFTHLTLNHLCYFLEKCYFNTVENVTIIISFWLIEENKNLSVDELFQSADASIKTSHIFDNYHCKFSQIECLTNSKWNVTLLDDFHPRQQKFVLFKKK